MRKEYTPHAYQAKIIRHILANDRNCVFASMGCGKTSSTLTALEVLYETGENHPTLVLAPLRVCNTTWPEEAKKWSHLHNIDVTPVTGVEKERLAALKRDTSIYAINYQNVPWLIEQYGAHWPFKIVVADECTRLKSFRTRQGGVRARALAQVAHTKIKRFINLTGTPAPNGLADLWGFMWFIDKGLRLEKSYSAYMSRWFTRTQDGFGYELRHESLQEQIYEKLKDVCLTVDAKDYFTLNDPIIKDIEVSLPRAAMEAYKKLEKELVLQLEKGIITAANAAVKTMKLLQIANGAAYLDPEVDDDNHPRAREYRVLHDAKIEALESIITEANGMPVLVAYHFRSDLERVIKHFKQAEVLDDSPETLRRWNAGRIPVLLAHPACLHPSTEVLTEFRGWVKITSVLTNERVFDGVEFVAHSGCQYSGYRDVIECFGITMTPEHKLLIQDTWTEARHVRDSENTRREARYFYKGDDEYLSKMLALRAGIGNTQTECRKTQSQRLNALPEMRKRTIPLYDSGRRGSRCASVDVPEEQKKAHVYDIVDCGPRNRFLIRNSKGEVFVSHNSAGHGLNLQDGGNILVFFGHNWNLEDRLQIIERIGPMRQKQSGHNRPVWIYNIIARGTVDRMVMQRVASKKSVQDLLLENLK